MQVRVRNETRGAILAETAEVADTAVKRRTGLLRHAMLAPGAGLWIIPCEAVHTFWMKFAIDVVFVDRQRRVRKAREAMPPWRLSGCLRAHSVLELPAGTIATSGTQAGDQLQFEKL